MTIIWKAIEYIAQDDKKTGLTWHKASYKILGIFMWECSWWQWIYSWIPIINLGVNSVLVLILGVVNGKAEGNAGFIELAKALVLVLAFSFSMVKLIMAKYYGNDFREAIEFFERQPMEGGVDNSASTRKFVAIYTTLLLSTGGCYAVYNTIMDGSIFPVYWPYELKPRIIFELIGYIQKLFCDFYCVFVHIIIDSTLPMMGIYLAYQGTRLEAFMKDIGKNKHNDYGLIKKSIDQHVIMLQSMWQIRRAFKVYFISEVIYAIAHTCVIAFSVVKVDNIPFVMTSLVPILCSAFTQLLVSCQAGERVRTTMNKVSFIIYNNTWYHSDLKVKKSMVIMQFAATKTFDLNSYGVVTACLATFLHSVQESISYFLALRTISAKL